MYSGIQGQCSYSGDSGPALLAQINFPENAAFAVDINGVFYFTQQNMNG